jgi:hypothetical protein
LVGDWAAVLKISIRADFQLRSFYYAKTPAKHLKQRHPCRLKQEFFLAVFIPLQPSVAFSVCSALLRLKAQRIILL